MKKFAAFMLALLYSLCFMSVGAEAKKAKLKAPQNVTYTVTEDTVSLKWDKVSGAETYRIYKFDPKTSKWERYRNTSSLSYTIKYLQPDTEYQFRIAAAKKDGRNYIEGKMSAKITAYTSKANAVIDKDGQYTTPEEVAEYIHTFGTLPSNFITKKEANRLGWSGGDLYRYADGKSIGGDRYGNYENKLPKGNYKECDVNYHGGKRGAERLVFSDTAIYYTDDHYKTFTQLY